MMQSAKQVALAGLLGICLAGSLFGAEWNAATNFNDPSNPQASDAFSYGLGAGEGGSFVPLTYDPTWGAGGVEYDSAQVFFPTSQITWNNTGSVLNYYTIYQAPDIVRLDPQTTVGSVLRFTAPTTDTYQFTGAWTGIDLYHAPTTWSIYSGTDPILQGPWGTDNFGAAFDFTFSLSLAAGDSVDFGVQPVNDCCGLSSGLRLDIVDSGGPAATPEPSTALIGFSGLGGMLLVRQRLQR